MLSLPNGLTPLQQVRIAQQAKGANTVCQTRRYGIVMLVDFLRDRTLIMPDTLGDLPSNW